MGLLDFLFPKKCINCRKFGEYVCANCFTKLSFAENPICLVCNKFCIDGLTHPMCKGRYTIDGAFCGYSYSGVMKKFVYSFKYAPYISDLGDTLVNFLYESLIQQEPFMRVFQHLPAGRQVFVPIPLSRNRERRRGYNQSEILAKKLAKLLDCSSISLLERIKETKPQFELKKEERKENIKGAFKIKNNELSSMNNAREKTVFLVDDVLTTGSTLLEAANILKRNGFGKVYGICLARDY